jgi:tRNA (guanosine-2'-O-)-methyltransferase
MTPEREEKIRKVYERRQRNLTVVFENVNDPHNISACLRSCDAVGVNEVYIITSREKTRSKLGKKSSASASKWILIHHFNNVSECLCELRKKYSFVYATHLGEHATDLYSMDLTQSVALVFGNEHAGVSAEVTALCDGNFVIPQMGMIQSLNISVACAVTLFEALRQRRLKGLYPV